MDRRSFAKGALVATTLPALAIPAMADAYSPGTFILDGFAESHWNQPRTLASGTHPSINKIELPAEHVELGRDTILVRVPIDPNSERKNSGHEVVLGHAISMQTLYAQLDRLIPGVRGTPYRFTVEAKQGVRSLTLHEAILSRYQVEDDDRMLVMTMQFRGTPVLNLSS